ncbi:MAG: O-antigen ligase family protein [Candidatus Paceibacteria bacterium]
MLDNISDNLKPYSIFHKWNTLFLFLLFFALRLLSFLLFEQIVLQTILTAVVFVFFVVLYFRDPRYAWYLLIGELLIAGSGQFFAFADLSIRSILLASFLLLACLHQIGEEYFYTQQRVDSKALLTLVIVLCTVGFYAVLGITNGHGIRAIRDLIPFAYLFLFFPSFYICRKKEDTEGLIRLLIVFVLGSAVFSLFTFILFSGGFVELQEPFYKWFRDVNLGKITNMGNGFFRIVEQSHLLITPIILIISSLLMKDEKHHHMWRVLLFASLLVFVLNLSRDYMLALVGGFVVLLYKHSWKRWLKVTSSTIAQALIIFIFISFIASGGQTLGMGLFEGRVSSIVQPESELSARTRMILLPEIIDKYMENPIIGTGLGATLEVSKLGKTTTEFDWGYFEMLVEFGAVGSAILLGALFFLMVALIRKIHHFEEYDDLHVGLLAGLIALGIINVTEPALFHIYGILYIVFTAVITLKTPDVFEHTVIMIYRIFHKQKDNVDF